MTLVSPSLVVSEVTYVGTLPPSPSMRLGHTFVKQILLSQSAFCLAVVQSPNLYFFNLLSLRFTLCAVKSYGFWQICSAMIHQCNIVQNNFMTLKKIPGASPNQLLLPKLLAASELFSVSIILPFLECHINRIIQYVAFSDWLLILSNTFKIHSFCYTTVFFFLPKHIYIVLKILFPPQNLVKQNV